MHIKSIITTILEFLKSRIYFTTCYCEVNVKSGSNYMKVKIFELLEGYHLLTTCIIATEVVQCSTPI